MGRIRKPPKLFFRRKLFVNVVFGALLFSAIGCSSAGDGSTTKVGDVSTQCERDQSGKCVTWRVIDLVFTPENDELWVTYKTNFAVERRGISESVRAVIAKVNLSNLNVSRAISICDAETKYPAFSPDDSRVAFTVGKSPQDRIAIANRNSNDVILREDRWNNNTYQPRFSLDGRTLYFLDGWFAETRVSAVDIKSGSFVDFRSRKKVSEKDEKSFKTFPFNWVSDLYELRDGKRFVFRGLFPKNAAANILDELSKRTGQSISRLRTAEVLYTFDVDTDTYALHPLSYLLDLSGSLVSKRQMHDVEVIDGERLYYVLSRFQTKSDYLYKYHEGENALFADLKKFGNHNFNVAVNSFAVSLSERWIAYAYDRVLDRIAGTVTTADLVLFDKKNERYHRLDLGSGNFRRVALGRCEEAGRLSEAKQ